MKKITVGLFSLLLFVGTTLAQSETGKLARLPKILIEKIANEVPGWTHRSVEPIEGSKNVIIEQWESDGMTIKVAISECKDKDDAVNALKDFRSQLKTEEDATISRGKADFRLVKDELPLLGDGGFTWNILGSEATAFRRDNFVVFVSIARRPNDYKETKLSNDFARRVAEALAQ